MTTLPETYSRRRVTGPLLTMAACLLTGCVSIFPESEPAQLYRFGGTAPRVTTTTSESSFTVFPGRLAFNRASAGDRLLTVAGTEVAYIKGARWVTSAEDLFNAALQRAFSTDAGAARLVGSGDADYLLTLEVQSFEARYHHGPDDAPEIEVAVQARLTATREQRVTSKRIRSTITASDNRVGPIVEAFDQAVTQVLDDLVMWVDTEGQAGRPTP